MTRLEKENGYWGNEHSAGHSFAHSSEAACPSTTVALRPLIKTRAAVRNSRWLEQQGF